MDIFLTDVLLLEYVTTRMYVYLMQTEALKLLYSF